MNTEKKLYQWDTGQKLTGCTGLYVDFPIDNEVYRVETADGMCIIPDELLQTSGGHKVYECMTNNTIRSFAFSVTPRPKPPDYVFTPTERLTFEGLVQKVDDAVADMIRKAESGEFDGHTPVKGTDYFTTEEIQQIQNEVSSGAIGEFKSVVDTETDKFNANATEKVNAYNQNDSEKTTSYNANATAKLNAYNTNANNRVEEFDSHTEQIQTDISELKSDLVNLADGVAIKKTTETTTRKVVTWASGLITPYGTISENSSYITSELITVREGQKIALYRNDGNLISTISRICGTKNGQYDETFVVLNASTPYIVPEGYDGIRCSISSAYEASNPYFTISEASIVYESKEKNDVESLKKYAISEEESTVDVERIVGKFVSATNKQLTTLGDYFYTDLFHLAKGDTITVTSKDPSGSAVGRISSWSSDGLTCNKIIATGTTNITTVSYTATEDVEYLRFSGHNSNSFDVILKHVVIPTEFQNLLNSYENKTNVSLSMFSDIAVCGDSYTAGSINTRDGDVGTLIVLGYAPYGNMLARMTGVNVTTYASGGADTVNYQTRDDCLPKLLSDNPKDMYLFALGINDRDKSSTVPLGDITDIKSDYTQNANSFYGNYGKIIAQVKEHAPNAKIIMSTVFIPTLDNGVYYDFSANAIKEIAEHFGVMFIDTKEVPFFSSSKYNNDINANGGHPTAPTYSAIAKGIKYLIDKCIENNIEYFNSYIPNPLT